MDDLMLFEIADSAAKRAENTVERVIKSLDVVCVNCDQKFGEHNGLNCPTGGTRFQELKSDR